MIGYPFLDSLNGSIWLRPLHTQLTHTCGSMERCMGGVRACWMPPLLNDSERGGSDGSEIRLETLCCNGGEVCVLIL